jgi:hypothetical protein
MKGGVVQNLVCHLLFGMAVVLLFQSAAAESTHQTENSTLQKSPVSQRALKGYHMDPAPVVEQPNDWNEWETLMKTWLSSRFLEQTKKSVDAEMLKFPEPQKFKCKISFWVSRTAGTSLLRVPIKMEPLIENRELNNHIRMFFLSFPKTLTRFPKGVNEDWVECRVTLVGNLGATEFSAKPTNLPPTESRIQKVTPPFRPVVLPPEIIAPGAFDP